MQALMRDFVMGMEAVEAGDGKAIRTPESSAGEKTS